MSYIFKYSAILCLCFCSIAQMNGVEQGSGNIPVLGIARVSEVADSILEIDKEYTLIRKIDGQELKHFPSSDLPEIISRQGLASSVRFLSFSPSFYLDGEELFFTADGAVDFYALPLEAISSIRINSPAYGALHGGSSLYSSVDFTLPIGPLSSDYTRLSAHWGADKRQRLSGLFLKKLGNAAAFGVSGAEFNGDNIQSEGDFNNRDFSAIAWGEYSGFRLSAFGARMERDTEIPRPNLTGLKNESPHLDSDRLIVHTKLEYGLPKAEFALKYTHQDEKRQYNGDPSDTSDSYYTENTFFVDGARLDLNYTGIKRLDLNIGAGTRVFTTNHRPKNDYNASILAELAISRNTSALLSYRVNRNFIAEFEHSPSLAIIARVDKNSIIRLNCYYKEGLINLTARLRGDEYDRFLVSGDGEYSDTINFVRSTEGRRDEKTLGAELEWQYSIPLGMAIKLRASYMDLENPGLWTFIEYSPYYVSWGSVDEIEKTVLIPLEAEFKYAPDSLLEFGITYNYNYYITDSFSNDNDFTEKGPFMIYGVPEHRIIAHIQEAREYWEGHAVLLLRLEGEALFGLKNMEGNEIDPCAKFRTELRLDYNGFSVFAYGKYALTDKDDGWENAIYGLDYFLDGSFYELPKWSWRAGVEWFFLD
ncbi:Plug domain-containing protein [bacterium]|nr:Plug domain-containing protein [bacterium]